MSMLRMRRTLPLEPVPTPGQHTDETVANVLGYDPAVIAGLRSAGAIA